MARLAKNKKYLILDDVRLSHRPKDDSIHLSSTDEDFPEGFHLPLQKSTFVEEQLRGLLVQHGVIGAASLQTASLPRRAIWEGHHVSSPEVAWSFFPIALGAAGGLELENPASGEVEHLLGVDVVGQQLQMSAAVGKKSNGDIATSPHILIGGPTGSGKSIVLRSILTGCILRPNHWRAVAIDLKGTDLLPYRAFSNVVLEVATTLNQALAVLRFAHEAMLRRYAEMGRWGAESFWDLPQHKRGRALMVAIDELEVLLSVPDETTPPNLEQKKLQQEMAMYLGALADLGHRAGVYLAMASRRPDLSLISEASREQIGARIGCGPTSGDFATTFLGSEEAIKVPANPRGRLYLKTDGGGHHGQGLYGSPQWLEQQLASYGFYPDGGFIPRPPARSIAFSFLAEENL